MIISDSAAVSEAREIVEQWPSVVKLRRIKKALKTRSLQQKLFNLFEKNCTSENHVGRRIVHSRYIGKKVCIGNLVFEVGAKEEESHSILASQWGYMVHVTQKTGVGVEYTFLYPVRTIVTR